MKKFLPNRHRISHPIVGMGNEKNGFFSIPHDRISDYLYFVLFTSGAGWEHASISLGTKKRSVDRCPTWEEMCYIKNLFWEEEECVVQYHPPKSEHVSMHPYCLHLWKPTYMRLPRPHPIMVGIPGSNIQR